VEHTRKLPLFAPDSLISLSSFVLYENGYRIQSKEVLETLDKVQIISCDHTSLSTDLVYKDDILGDQVVRHNVWATRLIYSPHFETTIIYVEYAERSLCSAYGRVFLLNTKGDELLSVVRVASATSNIIESTGFERGKLFKHRVSPDIHDLVINDDVLKQEKAAGRWLDHVVYLNWFRINHQGKVEMIKQEKL